MQDIARSLDAWDNFYVIVGSSAAALTGLQFVVVTLVMETRLGTHGNELGAFATPTIVHFCAALLVAATISAPWPSLFGPSFIIATCGLAGLLYSMLVVWRAMHQTGYKMVAEDWTWHVVSPLASYVALFVAGAMLQRDTEVSLFAIAGVTLFLVYIGIHNAWDTTTYVATQAKKPDGGRVAMPASATRAEPTAPLGTAGSSENR